MNLKVQPEKLVAITGIGFSRAGWNETVGPWHFGFFVFLFSNWYKYMLNTWMIEPFHWTTCFLLQLGPEFVGFWSLHAADESGVRWTETAQDPWQRGEATVPWPILAMPNQSLDEIGGLTCVICVHPLVQKMGLLFALIYHQVYKRLRFTIKLNPVSLSVPRRSPLPVNSVNSVN